MDCIRFPIVWHLPGFSAFSYHSLGSPHCNCVNFFPHQNWVYPGSNDAAALGSSQGPVGPQQHTHTIMCCEVFKRCLLKSAKITPLSKPAPPTMFPSMGGWEIRAVGQALGSGARVGRVRVSGAEATLSQCWDDFQKCSNHTLC